MDWYKSQSTIDYKEAGIKDFLSNLLMIGVPPLIASGIIYFATQNNIPENYIIAKLDKESPQKVYDDLSSMGTNTPTINIDGKSNININDQMVYDQILDSVQNPYNKSNVRPNIEEKQQDTLSGKNQEFTEQDNFVARVIFAETVGVSDEERELVAYVIQNRINHPGFTNKSKRLQSPFDVVNHHNAFEAINDPNNKQWNLSSRPGDMRNPKEQNAWQHSKELAQGKFRTGITNEYKDKLNKIVYYHDKSISMPRSWNNRYWTPKLEIKTPNFSFYSITPKR